jgi:hypothetical protein
VRLLLLGLLAATVLTGVLSRTPAASSLRSVVAAARALALLCWLPAVLLGPGAAGAWLGGTGELFTSPSDISTSPALPFVPAASGNSALPTDPAAAASDAPAEAAAAA